MAEVLTVSDLVKTYATDGQPVHAVNGVSMSVEGGEFVAILGSSGSGKSTLLHLIGGLDRPSSGSVTIEGQRVFDLSDRERTIFRRRRLGIVFQAYNLLPTLTAVENVALPRLIDGRNGPDMDSRARDLLAQVDLSHRLTHRPQAMSGGEQQRVALARAMMNDPALILADEPTGNLDTEHAKEVWNLLGRLARDQQRTIIAVTHELGAAAHADRVILIRDGKIADTFSPGKEHDAALVAARYAELAR